MKLIISTLMFLICLAAVQVFAQDFSNGRAAMLTWLNASDYNCINHYYEINLKDQDFTTIHRLVKNHPEWEVKKSLNYGFYDSIPVPVTYRKVQTSQRPVQYEDVPTAEYVFLQSKQVATKRLVILKDGTYISYCYKQEGQDSENSDRSIAEALMEEAKEKYFSESFYQGGVIEYAGGVFSFLEGGEKLNLTWPDLVMDPSLKANLIDGLDGFLAHYNYEEWKKLGLPLFQGALLAGIPGTGKSLVGKIIATNVLNKTYPTKFTYIHVQARHVQSLYDIRNIYNLARKLGSGIIFFEDVDLIAGTNRFNRPEVKNELMQQLSGIESLKGVLTVGTTNLFDEIDNALKRSQRLGLHYIFGPLLLPERSQLLEIFLKGKRNTDLVVEDWAKVTDNFTGSDLQQLVQLASDQASKRLTDSKQALLIKSDDMDTAFKLYKATKFKKLSGN